MFRISLLTLVLSNAFIGSTTADDVRRECAAQPHTSAARGRKVRLARDATPQRAAAIKGVGEPLDVEWQKGPSLALVSDSVKNSRGADSPQLLKNVHQTFVFADEKMFREHWILSAQDDIWSIENGALRFSAAARQFPAGSLKFRYHLDGEIAVEVLGYMNKSSLVTVHLCGERFIAEPRRNPGPIKLQILRRGNTVNANLNGRMTTTVLKENRADLPTGLSISWGVRTTAGGECWIREISVRAAEAQPDRFKSD